MIKGGEFHYKDFVMGNRMYINALNHFETERISIKSDYLLYYINSNEYLFFKPYYRNDDEIYKDNYIYSFSFEIRDNNNKSFKIDNDFYRGNRYLLYEYKNEIEVYNNKLFEVPIKDTGGNIVYTKTGIYVPFINTKFNNKAYLFLFGKYVWIYNLIFSLYFNQ